MSLWAFGFGVGIIAGLIGGNWLDRRDVLYICPRCGKRGGKHD